MSFCFIFLLEEEEAGCEGCSPFARCQNGLCICLDRYAGNGYDCHREWLSYIRRYANGKGGRAVGSG